MPLLIVAVAAVLRLADLGSPERLYFDEQFYANDAHEYLQQGVEHDRPAHPPLGKWLIAAGIAALGFEPVGWRAAAALAGTLTVLLTYLAGLRLFRSMTAAGVAAALLAVDGLALTMSRIAMLDAFLALFVVVGVGLLVVDHDRPARRWRMLAGVAFGCAVATKWSGLLALGAAIGLVAARDLADGAGRLPGGRGRRLAGGVVVPLVVVPLAVYVASWAGWFANYERTEAARERCRQPCEVGVVDVADAWIDEQVEMFRFQRRLPATHPYRSPPWDWPLLTRPVLFYLESCPEAPTAGASPSGAGETPDCVTGPGRQARIVGVGNPAVWWPGAAAVVGVTFLALRRRTWPEVVVAGFALGQYVPWFASWKTGYSFYLLPAAPFVCLALGAAAGWLRRPLRGPVVTVVVGLALAGLVWFRPVWYGEETSPGAQAERLWFDSWR